ncbi:MAG: hypothetical protein R3Y26_09985 [Rikenellaceae bacterium]
MKSKENDKTPLLNNKEEEHQYLQPNKETQVKQKQVWSIPTYDTTKYDSYIASLLGNNKSEKKNTTNKLLNKTYTVSWGNLQDDFGKDAHRMDVNQLSDTVKSEIGTKKLKKLDKKTEEEVKPYYKATNRFALSDRDNIENRVNNAFLKGEGLEDISINGNTYKGLLFDENSEQSKLLNKNNTFKKYFKNYLSNIEDIIRESKDGKDVNTDELSTKFETKLGKPNFSHISSIPKFDYYGLMGGVQNVTTDFNIVPISNNEYEVNTKMYLNDWYGADKSDVNNSRGTLKGNLPGLKEFFWLQHRYGYEPFPTQIIYESKDTVKLNR